jgi:hypothetical protein
VAEGKKPAATKAPPRGNPEAASTKIIGGPGQGAVDHQHAADEGGDANDVRSFITKMVRTGPG